MKNNKKYTFFGVPLKWKLFCSKYCVICIVALIFFKFISFFQFNDELKYSILNMRVFWHHIFLYSFNYQAVVVLGSLLVWILSYAKYFATKLFLHRTSVISNCFTALCHFMQIRVSFFTCGTQLAWRCALVLASYLNKDVPPISWRKDDQNDRTSKNRWIGFSPFEAFLKKPVPVPILCYNWKILKNLVTWKREY